MIRHGQTSFFKVPPSNASSDHIKKKKLPFKMLFWVLCRLVGPPKPDADTPVLAPTVVTVAWQAVLLTSLVRKSHVWADRWFAVRYSQLRILSPLWCSTGLGWAPYFTQALMDLCSTLTSERDCDAQLAARLTLYTLPVTEEPQRSLLIHPGAPQQLSGLKSLDSSFERWNKCRDSSGAIRVGNSVSQQSAEWTHSTSAKHCIF